MEHDKWTSDHLEWIDYLRYRGLISLSHRQELAHMLRSMNPSVLGQAVSFIRRMKEEHPDLWVAHRALQRITNGVKL